jgi:two-component system chemotaxis sensor kinase CheA
MIDQHRDAYREEAYEGLTVMESALLELEEHPDDPELVATVFRHMHTIKGSGAMFGFDDIASFTHNVETVFDLVRGGSIPVTRELIDLTLSACDQIRSMLDCSKSGGSVDQATTEKIMDAFSRFVPHAEEQQPATEISGEPAQPAPSPFFDTRKVYRIRFTPDRELFRSGGKPANLFNELRTLGEVSITIQPDDIPTLEEIDHERCYVAWDIVLVSTCTIDEIRDVFIFVADDSNLSIHVADDHDEEEKRLGEILVERGDISAEGLEEVLVQQKRLGEMLVESGLLSPRKLESALAEQEQIKEIHRERHSQEAAASIRVPAERLDQLVNLVGEQVTVHARLHQLALTLKMPELTAIAEDVGRLTADLRDSTLTIRMLPIGSTFSKFRRLVRDLSHELGKEIEMTTSGEETELDKTVIEKLGDPLIHLIRNSIDHAIELPEVRSAKGKPRQGIIHLAAMHSGDSVYISISDDGAGLDREAILKKGIERGLVPPNAELTEKEIFNLIFNPGFSTAKTVTSVSGRGVGMDVVKRSIEDLRGSIDIRSEWGRGTTITVRIPLTLAIIESLLVRVGDDHFMFPLSMVDECMFLTREEVARANGRQVVTVRDAFIPYIRLRERFETGGTPPLHEQMVIVAVDGEQVGFVVDHIIGQHQTVIKSLGNAYRSIEGVSGATILGNGSVALILDVPKLYQTALEQEAA